MDLSPHRLTDDRYATAESPVWDDRRQCLFWCDIPAGALHAVRLDGGDRRSWVFQEPLASLGLTESGRLVLALASRVALFDPATEALDTLVVLEADRPHTRLNDGKVGPDGTFWVGSMDLRADRQPIGQLWRVTGDGEARVMADGHKIGNGLAFSPDGGILYWSDSRGPWVDRFRLDVATGVIGDRQRLVSLDEATGRPDGAACDTEGRYWSAGVSAGRLNCFAPDGTLVRQVALPVSAPTMPCFVGPGLDRLVVTSLTDGQPAEALERLPWSGSLILLDVGAVGVPVGRMQGC